MTTPGVAVSPDVQIVRCRIKTVEPTGSDLLVVFLLDGKDVMARMRAGVTIGADLDIAFDLSKVSFLTPTPATGGPDVPDANWPLDPTGIYDTQGETGDPSRPEPREKGPTCWKS